MVGPIPQQLKHAEPCYPVLWVLAPSQDAKDVFNVGGLKKFKTTVFDEWNIPPGEFDLKLGTVMGGPKQDGLRFKRYPFFPRP